MKYSDNDFLQANKAINKVVNTSVQDRKTDADIKSKLKAEGKPATKTDVSIYHLEELLNNTDIQIKVAVGNYETLRNLGEKSGAYKQLFSKTNDSFGRVNTLLTECVHYFEKKMMKNINDFDSEDIINVGEQIDVIFGSIEEIGDNDQRDMPFMDSIMQHIAKLIQLYNSATNSYKETVIPNIRVIKNKMIGYNNKLMTKKEFKRVKGEEKAQSVKDRQAQLKFETGLVKTKLSKELAHSVASKAIQRRFKKKLEDTIDKLQDENPDVSPIVMHRIFNYVKENPTQINLPFIKLYELSKLDTTVQHEEWFKISPGLTQKNIQMLDTFVENHPKYENEYDPRKLFKIIVKEKAKYEAVQALQAQAQAPEPEYQWPHALQAQAQAPHAANAVLLEDPVEREKARLASEAKEEVGLLGKGIHHAKKSVAHSISNSVFFTLHSDSFNRSPIKRNF